MWNEKEDNILIPIVTHPRVPLLVCVIAQSRANVLISLPSWFLCGFRLPITGSEPKKNFHHVCRIRLSSGFSPPEGELIRHPRHYASVTGISSNQGHRRPSGTEGSLVNCPPLQQQSEEFTFDLSRASSCRSWWEKNRRQSYTTARSFFARRMTWESHCKSSKAARQTKFAESQRCKIHSKP